MLKRVLNEYSDYMPSDVETELIKANATIKRNVKAIEKILNLSCDGCWFTVHIQKHLNKMKGE